MAVRENPRKYTTRLIVLAGTVIALATINPESADSEQTKNYPVARALGGIALADNGQRTYAGVEFLGPNIKGVKATIACTQPLSGEVAAWAGLDSASPAKDQRGLKWVQAGADFQPGVSKTYVESSPFFIPEDPTGSTELHVLEDTSTARVEIVDTIGWHIANNGSTYNPGLLVGLRQVFVGVEKNPHEIPGGNPVGYSCSFSGIQVVGNGYHRKWRPLTRREAIPYDPTGFDITG